MKKKKKTTKRPASRKAASPSRKPIMRHSREGVRAPAKRAAKPRKR